MTTVTEQQRDSALSSLAILKVNFDQRQDYISNFVPFAAEVLRQHAPQAVSLPDMQRGIEEQFGLRIPQGALNTILRRAARQKLVVRHHGTWRPNFDALADSEFTELRRSTRERENALVAQLAAFASEQYGLDWDAGQAEAALLTYVDGNSSDLLCLTPRRPATAKAKGHTDVIVAGFVEALQLRDGRGFDFFLNIVKGTMLSNVLYLPGGFEDVQKSFGSTQFFLDTAFVLRAAGFSAHEVGAPCRELMQLLRDLNAPLRIFRHTHDEVIGALDSAVHGLRAGGEVSGPAEFLVTEHWTASDVEQFRLQLPQKLDDLGIEIVDRPPHTTALGTDETSLERNLATAMPNLSKTGIKRDVDSLTAVHRLRGGHCRPSLEDAEAVLVTTNGTLVYVANDFFRTHHGRENGVPWCIHAHALTTLAWLKRPTAAPNLPRLQVVADCFAALNPSDELWGRYRTEIERLRDRGDISPEDFHLLRYSDEARRALMLQTHGDPEVFTEGTVSQVLDRALANARAEAELALQQERVARAAEAQLAAEQLAEAKQTSLRQIEQAERDAAEAKSASEQATGEVAALKEAMAQDRARREKHLDDLARRGAKLISAAAVTLVVALIVLALGAGIAGIGDVINKIPLLPQAGRYAIVIITTVGLINGFSAKSVRRPIERVVQPPLRRLIGEPAQSGPDA